MRLAAVVAAVVLASPLPAASLESKIRRLLNKSPVAKQGFIGILVADERGRRLASIDAARLFVPASNTKLFSAALALERLGPDKRFETRVELRGRDLALIGTGDPNLSGRVIPYQYKAEPKPPLTVIDELAGQVTAAGITEIPGNVVGDDSFFPYEPFASGWSIEDALYDDGAPASALVVNDNRVQLQVTPGPQSGAPAIAVLSPPLPIFQIDSTVITGTGGQTVIHTDRLPAASLWRVWGTIPQGGEVYKEDWAVEDPALFAAMALKEALERHNIHVAGTAIAAHRLAGLPFTAPAPGRVIARHESPPLIRDLEVINKVSQNLHADLLLFDVGGSREGGLGELDRFLSAIGIKAGSYVFHDGSGLSRRNLVSPEAVVKLLSYMRTRPQWEEWLATLPVSGVDGSIAERLNGKRTQGRVHAKTGSLDHVSALSGYVEARKGRLLTFSIFVNNAEAPTASVRELIDKIVEAMAAT
jgi:D-alanyl-D-alanine carboxypeptidase/D-alanyl-D-alanine-endopeptidase (penicillin-binding protein 4)